MCHRSMSSHGGVAFCGLESPIISVVIVVTIVDYSAVSVSVRTSVLKSSFLLCMHWSGVARSSA